jgi:mono/diheme cytochrome c family protein
MSATTTAPAAGNRVAAAGAALEGLDFAAALAAHRAWKQRLLEMLRSADGEPLDPAEVARDDCCTLGRWLHGEGGARYGHGPQFGELLRTHRQFHASAAQVVARIQGGDLEAASKEIAGPFSAHSETIAALLSDSIHGRELDEPDEARLPAPWLLIAFVAAMLGWGTWYLATESGSDWAATGDQRTAKALAAAPKVVDGRQIYAANCAACHQPTGAGVPGAFPPLAGSEWVNGKPEVLARVLLHGLQGPVQVKGNTYNGVMPAFGAQMDDEQLAALGTFIRFEWGNGKPPLDAKVVAEERAKARATPWTAAELGTP